MGKKKGKKDKGAEEEQEFKPHEDAAEIMLQYKIEDLSFKLEEAKSEWEKCDVEAKRLKKQCDDDRKKHADIQFFLNQKLDHNYNEIERLEKALINLQSEKDMAEEAAEQKLDRAQEKMARACLNEWHRSFVASGM